MQEPYFFYGSISNLASFIVYRSEFCTESNVHTILTFHGLLEIHLLHHVRAALLAYNCSRNRVVCDWVRILLALECLPLVPQVDGLHILQTGSLRPLLGNSIAVISRFIVL